jgi:DNA mismatch endonuclease (patch repair protein)
MESLLRNRHVRYQRQPDLPGHPDFRVSGTNIVIFCDSSFWHGRRKNELDGSAFKKNREFWMTKLRQNRRRDMRTNRALRKLGWRVLRFSDAEILKRPENVARTLVEEIEKHE